MKVRRIGGTEPGKFGEPDAGAGIANHSLALLACVYGRNYHGLYELVMTTKKCLFIAARGQSHCQA